MAEEVSSNLDRKLFELLLAISRCLNNMEETLNTSVLSTEEAVVQQALYEVNVLKHPGKEKPQCICVTTEYMWPDISSLFCWYYSGITPPNRFGPIAFNNNYQLEPCCLLQARVLGQRPFSLMLSFFQPFRLFLSSCKNFMLI